MTTAISGTGVVFNDGTTQTTSPFTGGFAFRNRIINGAMMIDQRNAGTSVNVNNYTVDRWSFLGSQTSKGTVQQNAGSVTPPTGFTNYLGFTSSSAYSVLSSDYFYLQQPIEGLNVTDLAWGTANAQTVTLSFWVRSSLTGTFAASLRNNDANRSYPLTYTISSANTWEKKTVSVSGDTSGTWLTNNLVGIYLSFSLGVGSTQSGTAGAWAGANYTSATGAQSVVGTNGATFYITGVQLEIGSTATSFDYRPYGTELALCQRYLPVLQGNGTGTSYGSMGICNSTTSFQAQFIFPVAPRVAPTGLVTTAVGNFAVNDSASAQTATAISFTAASLNEVMFSVTVSSGLTQFRAAKLQISSGSQIQFTGCEL